jgi:2-methylcitrate dehydratase PrpD
MSARLLGFAAGGYAFRERERAAVKPVVLATVAQAAHDAHATPASLAAAAFPAFASRLRASVIGRDERTGPIDAALRNGIAAAPQATLATPIVCAALAAAEASGAPGATVLDAVVAGLEVALRVERALSGHVERGWDVRGTCGRLGAAIAAARGFGLQRAQVHNAFALAATAAGGLLAARGTMAEAWVIGSAAADGVEAALLARADFTGARAALEGRRGFAVLMADALDAEALVAGVGERFLLDGFAEAPADAAPALREAVDRLDRAASLDALLTAARG